MRCGFFEYFAGAVIPSTLFSGLFCWFHSQVKFVKPVLRFGVSLNRMGIKKPVPKNGLFMQGSIAISPE
jgi:hypothetical protein